MRHVLLSMDEFIAGVIAQTSLKIGVSARGLQLFSVLLFALTSLFMAVSKHMSPMGSILCATIAILSLVYWNMLMGLSEEQMEKIYMTLSEGWLNPWRPINCIMIPPCLIYIGEYREWFILGASITFLDYCRSLHIAHVLHNRPSSS